jgi:hypothetical protein
MRASVRSCMFAFLLGVAPIITVAQTTQPSSQPDTMPTTEPATNPTTMPATLPTTGPSTNPTTRPTTTPATAPAATQPAAAPAAALSGTVEGTFFPDQEGRLERSKDDREIEFVYDKDGKPTEVPILPNLELMRLENAVEDAGWNVRFRASGWITEYHDKNYILIDHASRVEDKAPADTTRPVP